jgi:hypothetical protein
MLDLQTPLRFVKDVEIRYSRSFKRRYKNGILISETKIPTLSLENILNILFEMRKAIEPFIIERIQLNDRPSTWGIYESFLMYHVLFLKMSSQNTNHKYITAEDEQTSDPIYVETLSVPTTPNNPKAFYFPGLIGVGDSITDSVFITFMQPPEKIIVTYLRAKRKHYDLLRDRDKFVLFHNMLTRIILTDVQATAV